VADGGCLAGHTLDIDADPVIKRFAMSRYLTMAPNAFVADLIRGRLSEAGIPSYVSGDAISTYARGAAGADSIYVDDADLERARQVLADAQGVSEDELCRLSEETAAAVAASSPPHPVSVRTSDDDQGSVVGRFFRKIAGRSGSWYG
jgi:hypothetical protein